MSADKVNPKPDFRKIAQGCVENYRDRSAAWDIVEGNINAALNDAYNAGFNARTAPQVEQDKASQK